MREHEEELGIRMVPFQAMLYVEDWDTYLSEDEGPEGARTPNISDTERCRRLAEGREIPSWFTFPQVAAELKRRYRPRHRQGFTVFFTGLSGAGKSTVAMQYAAAAMEMAGWLAQGKLKTREDIVEGLETFPETLQKLFTGENQGKLLIKVR